MRSERAALMAQAVKNAAEKQEIQEMVVQSLRREDPLEKEMATPSSILVWEIPWTEEPGGLPSMASQRVGHDLLTKTTTCYANFFKCSCKDGLVCLSSHLKGNLIPSNLPQLFRIPKLEPDETFIVWKEEHPRVLSI